MSEKYPKYQFINYDTHYITFRKYLDKLNYIDIDFPYEELEHTLNKGIVLQDRINKAIEILHNINEDLLLDLILTEIEHTKYVLKGDKE